MWNISSTDFKGASLLQTIILANHPATLKYSLSWVEDRHKLTVFYLNIIATGSMQFRNVRDVLKEEYTNILPVSWICSPPGSRAQTVFNLLLHGPVEISLEMTIKALHLPFVSCSQVHRKGIPEHRDQDTFMTICKTLYKIGFRRPTAAKNLAGSSGDDQSGRWPFREMTIPFIKICINTLWKQRGWTRFWA